MSQVVCSSTLSYETLQKENYDRQGSEGGRRKNNHASELIRIQIKCCYDHCFNSHLSLFITVIFAEFLPISR